jgi:hypothetical protein
MKTPWWLSELYSKSSLLPPVPIEALAGPHGPAYVQVYPNDSTAPGWGEELFMPKYIKRAFSSRRAEVVYTRNDTPFALVMRSMSMVCIDIDGKNDGFQSAAGLILPPTLAETSKSGNGFHLFYTVDDTWDPQLGFAKVRDKIGFMQGIDLRGTGCVFHYPQQQWNTRQPVPLPAHMHDKLNERPSLEKSIQAIQVVLDSDDPVEVAIMQDNVASRLTAPIPQGRRNNTLFAIGAEMNRAQIVGWEKQVYERALDVGLAQDEVEKLIRNIRNYG